MHHRCPIWAASTLTASDGRCWSQAGFTKKARGFRQNRDMKLWNTFVEVVATNFRFLETEFGFLRTLTKQPNLIYASHMLQVQVYYDADGRHELDLRLRRLADDPRKALSLGIGMLMRLNGSAEGYLSPFPSTPESLEAEVKRLSELLRKHGSTVLSGDLRDFARAEQVEREVAEKFGTPKQSR
jgi:hypothetical protein